MEDNTDLAASLVDYLEFQGHSCDWAANGVAGFNLATANSYDFYIFDIAMPKKNGISLCEALKAKNDVTPVLFLTARDTLEDKLAGFSAGADDYLIKPFDLDELNARIQAIHKRYIGDTKPTLHVGQVSLDQKKQIVKVSGAEVNLSPNNYKLLLVLMQRSPEVVSREELEHIIWGEELPDSDSLRTHIYKLRNKIDKPFNSELIKTVKGRGFSIS
ncbi:MAG: response regulator transcription factor [Parashewanella sp.]